MMKTLLKTILISLFIGIEKFVRKIEAEKLMAEIVDAELLTLL